MINKVIQFRFSVAISPFILFPGIDGGEFKSMRLAGVSGDPFIVDGPGAPLRPVGGGERLVLSPTEIVP